MSLSGGTRRIGFIEGLGMVPWQYQQSVALILMFTVTIVHDLSFCTCLLFFSFGRQCFVAFIVHCPGRRMEAIVASDGLVNTSMQLHHAGHPNFRTSVRISMTKDLLREAKEQKDCLERWKSHVSWKDLETYKQVFQIWRSLSCFEGQTLWQNALVIWIIVYILHQTSPGLTLKLLPTLRWPKCCKQLHSWALFLMVNSIPGWQRFNSMVWASNSWGVAVI